MLGIQKVRGKFVQVGCELTLAPHHSVEAAQVVATNVPPRTQRHPLAAHNHAHSVLIGQVGLAVRALVPSAAGVIFGPFHLRPFQHLGRVAFRALHRPAPVVAFLQFGLDAGRPANSRGAGLEQHGVVKVHGPRIGQGAGVTLLASAHVVRVDLILNHHLCRNLPQARWRVAAGDDEAAAWKLFAQNRVARIAGARVAYLARQPWCLSDHRGQFLLAKLAGRV